LLIGLGRRSRVEDKHANYYLLTQVKEKDPSKRTNYSILRGTFFSLLVCRWIHVNRFLTNTKNKISKVACMNPLQ
jgi:hypothetical protein